MKIRRYGHKVHCYRKQSPGQDEEIAKHVLCVLQQLESDTFSTRKVDATARGNLCQNANPIRIMNYLGGAPIGT